MKKLLYIPLTAQSPGGAQEDDLFRAFQKEYDVYLPGRGEINFDLIHVHAGAIRNDVLKLLKAASKLGVKTSVWTGDASYAPLRPVLSHKLEADVFMLGVGGGQRDMYQRLLNCGDYNYKPRIEWMPEAVADWQCLPPKELELGKIVFVGNHYDCFPGGEERLETFRFLSQRFGERFEVYGEFRIEGVNCMGPLPWERVPDIYNDAYIVIAMDNYFDIEGYFTHRHLGAMATSCSVARVFEGISEQFKHLENCVMFRNKYEAHDMIQFLLDNPGIRNEIAQRSHAEIKKNWTYDSWVKRYKKIVCG